MKIREKRGITLISLVVTIVVLLILAGVSISMLVGDNGIINQATNAKEKTEKASALEEVQVEVLGAYDTHGSLNMKNAKKVLEDNLKAETLEYKNGLIVKYKGYTFLLYDDGNVKFGDGEETVANEPNLTKNMTPIKWDGYTEIETTSDDKEWYNYKKQSNETKNGGTSRWANAKNSDGSYFVWIPRFAYKITFYTNASKKEVSKEKTLYADIDIVFLDKTSNNYIDKNGEAGTAQIISADVGEGYTNSQKNGDKYTVHPAFTNGISNGFVNGEWDNNIEGFWIAKFEMSMETNGEYTETTSYTIGNVETSNNIKAVSKPGVSSWRYCKVGNWYTNGLNYESTSNSHAIKNSEWGAVAYLTYSDYGRNGTKITINNSSSFITGNAGDTINSEGLTEITNAYNTEKGVLASTTGNIYGVYDMNGGAYDTTMAYITSGNSFLTTYGDSFVNTDYSLSGDSSYRATSTKYATAYIQGESTPTLVGIESAYNYWNKTYGDAITEISIENLENTTGYPTIYEDFIEIEQNKIPVEPFFIRGGNCEIGSNAGIFAVADFASSVYNNGGGFSSRFILIP